MAAVKQRRDSQAALAAKAAKSGKKKQQRRTTWPLSVGCSRISAAVCSCAICGKEVTTTGGSNSKLREHYNRKHYGCLQQCDALQLSRSGESNLKAVINAAALEWTALRSASPAAKKSLLSR